MSAVDARPRPRLRALRELPTIAPRPVPSTRALAGFWSVVAVITVVTYWPQIAHPALYRDDWQFAWSQLTHPHDFLAYALRDAVSHNRPIYVLVNHLLTACCGTDARALLLIGLLIDTLECIAAFVLLSVLGMGRWRSGLVAALVMIYPLADSTRLMSAMATTTIGVSFYLVGATLAIRALAKPARESRCLHGAAIAFYLLSLLTYEAAAGLIVLSFLVYRITVPWRTAIRHWLVDILVLGVLFGGFLIVNRVVGEHVDNPVQLADVVGRVAVFAYESAGAVALSTFPAGPALVTRTVVVERAAALLILLMLLAGGYVWFRRRGGGRLPSAIRRWEWTIAAAAVAVAPVYLPYALAGGAYHPLARGEGNRINELAAIPLLVIAYGLVSIGWAVVVGCWRSLRRRSWRRDWPPLHRGYAVIPAAALVIASVVTVRGDITRWQYTAARQRQLQGVVRRALATERGRFSVVVVGPLDLFSPGIPHPAAHEVLDLLGTFSVPLGRRLQVEYLVAPGTRFTCRSFSMFPAGAPGYPSFYGKTLLLRSPWTRPAVIADQRACLAVS